jgi:hypothetical protein
MMAINGEDRRQPPRVGAITSADVDGTATTPAAVTNLPPAGGYMTFENAGTTTIHIVFGPTAASLGGTGAPTTTTKAMAIGPGLKEDFYMSAQDAFWSAIGSAAGGKLRYRAS